VWEGKGSNEFERKNAHSMIDRVLEKGHGGKKVVTFEEGSEPESFWKVLGGKGTYSNEESLWTKGDVSARLFQCTDRTGVFKVMEIPGFSQDDLDDDDVMLLDAFNAVFVWVGSHATENEKNSAKEVAAEYVKQADDGRDTDAPIYVLNAGSEPLQFTVYFAGWDDERMSNDIYSRKLTALKLEGNVVGGVVSTAPPASSGSSSAKLAAASPASSATKAAPAPAKAAAAGKAAAAPAASASGSGYPDNPKGLVVDYDRLKVKPPPEGVDGSHLEAFLSDAQFKEFMKMGRDEYYALPKWQSLRVKKASGLF